jgi:sigma-B regulation protein RsbU (phosphoserine phosphatase)
MGLQEQKVEFAAQDQNLSEDLISQLKMAGQVQRNFLPDKMPDMPNLKWATFFKPADWVSGDIYDAVRLDENNIGFYLIDAVGHSMPAALLTIYLKQAIQLRETIGNYYRIFPPDEVLDRLNKSMLSQKFKGTLFATCFYAVVNVKTLEMTFARAGHPYPVLIKNSGEFVQLQSQGSLLGVFAESVFQAGSIQLSPGDKFILYSDGSHDLIATCDDSGRCDFTDSFKELACLDIEKVVDELEKHAGQRTFDKGHEDDQTIISFQIY